MSLAVYISSARDAIPVVIVGRSRQEVVLVSPGFRGALPIRPVGTIDGSIPVVIVGSGAGRISEYSLLGTLGGDYIGVSPKNDYILVTGV